MSTNDPLTILGLKPGDLLVAAACLHRYRDRAAIAGATLPAETIVCQTQQREGTR